jgi:hypothetical protein
MKPVVNINPMSSLSNRLAKNICGCPKLCKRFITIVPPERYGDSIVICEKDSKRYIADLENALGLSTHGRWTTGQEITVINYINRHGVEYGTYAKLGKKLGKTRQQVGDKVRHLRAVGRL